jgi:hypothetical protein
MRRLSAILLLGLFGFFLAAPALLADAGSDLPACCRRDGRHHCGRTAPSGPSLQAVCGFFAKAGAAPAFSRTPGVPTATAEVAARSGRASKLTESDGLCRLSYSRTHQKRGPPGQLS